MVVMYAAIRMVKTKRDTTVSTCDLVFTSYVLILFPLSHSSVGLCGARQRWCTLAAAAGCSLDLGSRFTRRYCCLVGAPAFFSCICSTWDFTSNSAPAVEPSCQASL